jgi:hypothetical protein
MFPMSGLIMVLAMEPEQAVMVGVHQEAYTATITTVPTVGATPRDAFLPAETDHAIPAVAAPYIYLCSIVEHGLVKSL